ncbi:MAG TPA: ChbG/HpnK family deacetylase [Azospirillaceae bacterium]|nr:ChbG/HpnK family deacetylase [Azospirillaceae bacterium]
MVQAPVPVTVCADDYALSPGVSDGIRELIELGRVTATGCMALSPYWPGHAPGLREGPAEAGLHVTLTNHAPLGPMPLLAPSGRLPSLGALLKASLRGLPTGVVAEARGELVRQLDRFEQAMGRPPAFVDGHQHVHLLPGLRGVVLEVLAARYPAGTVWLRDCAEPLPRILARRVAAPKAAFIAALATGLRGQAAALGIPTNRGFRGVYDLRPGHDFGRLFAAFLDPARPGALIMVHPARPDAVLAGLDPVVEARHAERDWLASPAADAAFAKAGAVPARLNAG